MFSLSWGSCPKVTLPGDPCTCLWLYCEVRGPKACLLWVGCFVPLQLHLLVPAQGLLSRQLSRVGSQFPPVRHPDSP